MTQSLSSSSLHLAVTGAMTPVGREVINLLAERDFPLDEIYAVETGAVTGEQISFGDDEVLDVQKIDTFDFGKTQLIIHAGAMDQAEKIMKFAIGNKAKMIDLSGFFAEDSDVPCAVAGVNEDILKQPLLKSVVAVPSSAATILALALKPIKDMSSIDTVTATIFDPAVTGGRGAMDEVFNQTKAMFMNSQPKSEHYMKQIAFNAIPMVGEERDDGHTTAEFQTKSALGKIYPQIKATVTHVSVPIFTGMGISVTVRGQGDLSAIKAAMQMTGQAGLGVIDDHLDIPTPAEIGGEDLIYVARLRGNVKDGLQFWLCGDSIRRGQALNAVMIAEELVG